MLVRAASRLSQSAARPGATRVVLCRSPGALFARECSSGVDLATRKKNALILLGLESSATANQIKKAYYMLAKRTHPDVIAREAREAAAAAAAATGPKVVSYGRGNDGILDEDHAAQMAKPTVVPFLEVQAAYGVLMQEDDDPDGAKKARTKRAGAQPSRERTLGEVLCDRLKDEPEAHAELWEEILRDKMRVTELMLEAIFKAIRTSADVGAKANAARVAAYMIHDGTYQGVLNIDTRCSAFVTLLTWCQAEEEELADVALEIIDQITDDDRAHSPAVMAAIGSVFCSGTRSPY